MPSASTCPERWRRSRPIHAAAIAAALAAWVVRAPAQTSEITQELGHQYWLAYSPTTSTGGFKRVSVRLEAKPLLRARTRTGYYASGPRSSASATNNPRGRQ